MKVSVYEEPKGVRWLSKYTYVRKYDCVEVDIPEEDYNRIMRVMGSFEGVQEELDSLTEKALASKVKES